MKTMKFKYDYKREWDEAGNLASSLCVEPADLMVGRLLLEVAEGDWELLQMDGSQDKAAAKHMAKYFLGNRRYKAFKKEYKRERGKS